MTSTQQAAGTPSQEEVLAFLREATESVPLKEIAQAFGLHSDDRAALRVMLKQMVEVGSLQRDRGSRGYLPGRGLPPVTIVEVVSIDTDGELLARPATWKQATPPPPVYLSSNRRGTPALAQGDRVLARLTLSDDGSYEAQPIRVLAGAPKLVLGVYQKGERGGRLLPTDRRARSEFILHDKDALEARPGELVLAEVKPRQSRLGLREVRVRERRGEIGGIGNLSLIAALEHDLPMAFVPAALEAAAAAGPVGPGERSDLRDTPLITIDGSDARDFDDAVWAERDPAPDNREGWHLIVAIADVAHYVHPGSPLDKAAYERGNSAYFPDRVIPMLPEALSNGWCSLVPGEDRPCLAVHLWLDRSGGLTGHRFVRGLMRSAARLTYEQVQAAHDGVPDSVTRPLLDDVITPLYGAYEALVTAREARGTLDLELPERQIELGADGKVVAIAPRQRLDSHRLIEEMMITANVAAAQALEARTAPCVYRVHDSPDPQKLEALRDVLDSFGLRLARGQVIRPGLFRQILEQVKGEVAAPLVNTLILRSQSQAVYATENHGHFGLALPRYAHFTSPIRRYSDLLVHRSLITAYRLGAGGLDGSGIELLSEAADHISTTERRAQAAERESDDRFVAAFLQDRTGQDFPGRISGVTRFGLFVTLDDLGADGLIPVSTLPDDRYDHIAAEHILVGRRWGRAYRLGSRVTVRLTEANPITGGMIFNLVGIENDPRKDAAPGSRNERSKRGSARSGRSATSAHKRKRRGGTSSAGRSKGKHRR